MIGSTALSLSVAPQTSLLGKLGRAVRFNCAASQRPADEKNYVTLKSIDTSIPFLRH